MSALERLRAADYVATVEDIREITKSLDSPKRLDHMDGVYFCALIATTQHELGMAVRERAAPNIPIPTKAETARQLAALALIHDAFYHVVRDYWRRERLLTGRRLYSRCAFARAAKSVLRRWLAAGHNLAALVPSKTTQRQLSDSLNDLEPTVERDKRAIVRTVDRALRRIEKLPHYDRIASALLIKQRVDKVVTEMQPH